MLPFHKRARANSSIEIDAEDLEAIELPNVRPPSVRPGAFIPKSPLRQRFESYDDEMTVVRMDKRVSTSPPPRVEFEMPRMPASRVPRFERPLDDEPTQMHVSSSRPLLTMSSTPPRSVFVASEPNHYVPPPPPSSRARVVEDAPRSTAAVDASSSAHVRAVDLSMTSSLSGSTDIRKLRRPTMGWATGLVALGVFAGIITAFVARGEGLATAAAFIDPSHSVTADVAKVAAAQPQAPVMAPGAAVVQQQPVQKPAAPSCNADAVPAKSESKAEAKVDAKEAKDTAKAEKVVEKSEPKPEVKLVQKSTYVAPPVHHVEQQVREPAAVAVANPPPAKPVTKPARHASSNDMESASAADALAKAQLEAALSR